MNRNRQLLYPTLEEALDSRGFEELYNMSELTYLLGFCENTVIGLKPFLQKFKHLF